MFYAFGTVIPAIHRNRMLVSGGDSMCRLLAFPRSEISILTKLRFAADYLSLVKGTYGELLEICNLAY